MAGLLKVQTPGPSLSKIQWKNPAKLNTHILQLRLCPLHTTITLSLLYVLNLLGFTGCVNQIKI